MLRFLWIRLIEQLIIGHLLGCLHNLSQISRELLKLHSKIYNVRNFSVWTLMTSWNWNVSEFVNAELVTNVKILTYEIIILFLWNMVLWTVNHPRIIWIFFEKLCVCVCVCVIRMPLTCVLSALSSVLSAVFCVLSAELSSAD